LTDLGAILERDSAATDQLTAGELFAIRDFVDLLLHGDASTRILAATRVRANMRLVRAAWPELADDVQSVADGVLSYAYENDLIKPVGLEEAVRRVGEDNLRMICNIGRAFYHGDPETQIQAAKLLQENFDIVRAVWPQYVPRVEARISQTLLRIN
jgi:hypothetical protein